MRVFLCPECRGPPSACAGIHLLGSLPPRQQRGGVGGLRILSPAERSAGERTRELSRWFGADRLPRHRPRVPTRHRADPLRQPPSQPRTPEVKHGLLHRERLLQAGRRHSRHPSGRSGCQRGRCQNPGEFPGPHGEEEDKERRARPEGPGPRGTRRSWGRPGRRGRRPQRRLGQFPETDGCRVPFAVTRLPCRVCDPLLSTNLPASGALSASPRDSPRNTSSISR